MEPLELPQKTTKALGNPLCAAAAAVVAVIVVASAIMAHSHVNRNAFQFI